MSIHPGTGYLLQVLSGATNGNAEAFGKARNRRIATAALAPYVDAYKSVGGYTEADKQRLEITFTDGAALAIEDTGQSCCEHRHLTCDDDLDAFAGAILIDIELRDGPEVEECGDCHEQQFIVVTTSAGSFTVAAHNEHNGYYGGICPVLMFSPPAT